MMDRDYERFLQDLEERSLLRHLRTVSQVDGVNLRIGETELINFASNDYLGLSQHPAVKRAAVTAIESMGTGSGASRLITGTLSVHSQLESAIAKLKETEAALVFSSGYAAAAGVIPALAGQGDIVILDKLAHACLIDGAKLSGAQIRVFRHNDLQGLKSRLEWARKRAPKGKVLVITESVFSMDGDRAPLREMGELKARYGALLFVDEAHATGTFGPHGAGLISELDLRGQVDIQMGTLSKAIGASGGFIAGSKSMIEFLVNRARTFIFSTAAPPAVAASALASIKIIESAEGQQLRHQLWSNVEKFVADISDLTKIEPQSPILPLLIGDETQTMTLAQRLQEAGFLIPGIRFPTVARGSARLRVTLSALHTPRMIEELAIEIKRLLGTS